MSDCLQLDAVGTDLRLPDADYRIAPTTELDLVFEDRRMLEREADAHGGVLFRMRDHVEDPWQTCLILRPAVAWSVLELGGHTFGAGGEHLALIPMDPEIEPPGARHSPASFVLAHGDIWESDHFRLRPHPIVVREPLRDWPWVWEHATFGPISLAIDIERRHYLESFVAACAPMPYQQIGHDHYRVAPDTFADLRLVLDGLELTRGHSDPPPEVVAFDAGLLVALAHGALGKIGWAFTDEDYFETLAAGDDGATLLDYLDPTSDAHSQRAALKRQALPRRYDASAAATPGQLVETLARLLGARAPISDHLFDAWLAALPLDALPRHVEIHVSRALADRFGVEWLLRRLGTAQPRLRWTTRVS